MTNQPNKITVLPRVEGSSAEAVGCTTRMNAISRLAMMLSALLLYPKLSPSRAHRAHSQVLSAHDQRWLQPVGLPDESRRWSAAIPPQ